MPEPLLQLRGIEKSFTAPDGTVQRILDVPAFEIAPGEHVALAGTSGTGKTTLLHVIAGILRAESGVILWHTTDAAPPDPVRAGSARPAGAPVDVAQFSESARDLWRAQNIGYVFQSFHLLQGYTAVENVVLGMAFGPGPDPAYARALLTELNLGDRLDHRPRQMSVGQQQRVALARALANRPRLVLADEPTGNLDVHHAREALEMMRRMCREHGAALLLVSHAREILGAFERSEDLAKINRAARVDGERVGGAA